MAATWVGPHSMAPSASGIEAKIVVKTNMFHLALRGVALGPNLKAVLRMRDDVVVEAQIALVVIASALRRQRGIIDLPQPVAVQLIVLRDSRRRATPVGKFDAVAEPRALLWVVETWSSLQAPTPDPAHFQLPDDHVRAGAKVHPIRPAVFDGERVVDNVRDTAIRDDSMVFGHEGALKDSVHRCGIAGWGEEVDQVDVLITLGSAEGKVVEKLVLVGQLADRPYLRTVPLSRGGGGWGTEGKKRLGGGGGYSPSQPRTFRLPG